MGFNERFLKGGPTLQPLVIQGFKTAVLLGLITN